MKSRPVWPNRRHRRSVHTRDAPHGVQTSAGCNRSSGLTDRRSASWPRSSAAISATGDPLAAYLPNGDRARQRCGRALKGGEYEASLLGLMKLRHRRAGGDRTAAANLGALLPAARSRVPQIDPTQTSMTGYKAIARIERRSGRHWLWDTEVTAISPGLESNDIGRTLTGDGLRHIAKLRYRETRPDLSSGPTRSALNVNNEWTYDKDPHRQPFRPSIGAHAEQLLDGISTAMSRNLRVIDRSLTRGGPLMQRPAGWTLLGELGNAVDLADPMDCIRTGMSPTRTAATSGGASVLFSFRPVAALAVFVEPRNRSARMTCSSTSRHGAWRTPGDLRPTRMCSRRSIARRSPARSAWASRFGRT